jgi:dienelactone hydrolase
MLSPFPFQIAPLVFDLAFENIIRAAVIAHPSLLKPESLDVRNLVDILASFLSILSQSYIEKSKAPLLINSCEHDELFPKPLAETADKKFASFAPGYRRTYYEGVSHGFAVRGDLVRLRVFLLGYGEAHSTYSCTEQADGKSREGRGFQGVGGVADQIPSVKRRPRRDSDE